MITHRIKASIVLSSITFALLFTFAPGAIAANDEWWPIDVSWVTNAPQDVGIAEKMEKGVVHEGKYIPPIKSAKSWKLGLLVPHLKDPWWVAYVYGFVKECERLNLWATILSAGGYEHLNKQIGQLESLVTQKMDAIILNPISFEAQKNGIVEAKKSGIPVIAAVNDIRTDEVLSRVEISYWTMGYQAGKWVIEDAAKRGLSKAYAAYLAGPAGAGWSEGQVNGFKEAIKNSKPSIELVEVKWGEMDKGVQMGFAEDILTTFKDKLNYMIGDSLPMTAAVGPLQQRDLVGQVKLVATATTEEAFEYVKQGKISSMGTSYPVLLGRLSVDMAVTYLNGDYAVQNILNFPDVIGTVPYFVSKKNIDGFDQETAFAAKGWSPVFNVRPNE